MDANDFTKSEIAYLKRMYAAMGKAAQHIINLHGNLEKAMGAIRKADVHLNENEMVNYSAEDEMELLHELSWLQTVVEGDIWDMERKLQ